MSAIQHPSVTNMKYTVAMVEVNLTYEATHRWEGADSIPEVSFLKYPHRHVFHIRCLKSVDHDNRSIEFIVWKRQILKYLEKYDHDFGLKSCEMIGRELLEEFDCVEVRVMEDGENGAVIVRTEKE